MAPWRWCACFLLVTVVYGCASTNARETALREAEGHATQEHIRQQWGDPKTVHSLDNGETVWTYEQREQQPGNRYAAPGMWCEEYALTFDRGGLLSRWTRRSYFHGGELMPEKCIPQ